MRQALIFFLILSSLLLSPSSAVSVDVPDFHVWIASAGVTDAINGRYGDVIFATDTGISFYGANGTWHSVNARFPGETTYGLLSPLDSVVTAIALDTEGHLWIGYPNGLQIGDGKRYRSIQDQQFLKNLNIGCIVRWGDDMWVAAGRAGLHRYHDGAWTWYKPFGPEGLGCYTVVSMAVDAASDALIIGSEQDGVWVLRERTGAVRFEPVTRSKDRDFDIPSCIAVDASGNVYVADSGNQHIQKFDGSGNLLATLGGRHGEFSSLDDMAIDAAGNIYAVDRCNHCIQKFDHSGNLIATWGSCGTGEGEFRSPAGIAVGASGVIYVADTGNSRIQVFDTSGRFLKAWGNQGKGDGEFGSPVDVAVDASGNVYVVDPGNTCVQKFDSSGRFLMRWESPDDGKEFQRPSSIVVDASGALYVFDRVCIRKLDSSGNLLARWGSQGTADGEFSSSDDKVNMAIDAAGNIYVTDRDNHRIQKFDGSGNLLAKWESDTPGAGEFLRPSGIAVDASGNIYVADTGNNRIQKFDASGRYLTTLGSLGFGDGELRQVSDVAIDPFGNIYVADSANHRIQKFGSSGKFLKKWGSQGSGSGQFQSPRGIAVDTAGNIYVADSGNHRIQKFDGSGNLLATWGSRGSGDGQFQSPEGIAVDAAGNIYVADSGNHRIQKFDGSGNFLGAWGELQWPSGIAVDASGSIYVADTSANCIRIFDGSGDLPGTWQFRDTGSEAFSSPSGMASDASGNIYVVNRGSHCVQKFTPSAGKDSGTPGYTLVTKWGTKAYRNEPLQGISEVRVDPFGGVYLFNRTTVLHYDPGGKVAPILDAGDLNPFPVAINDIAATSGGMLLIATDDGIYGWNASGVALQITSGDGIRSNVVKRLFIDADGRCWFVVPGNVGYIPPMAGHATLDLAAAPVLAPHETEAAPVETPTADTPSVEPAGVPDMLSGAWASFVEWVNARLAGA